MTPDANALDVGKARDALDRFINLAFDKGGDRPRFSIPANPDCDDDLILSAALSRLDALEAENARLRDAARLALRLAMRDFSEDNYCAGWNSRLDELIASNDCEKAKSIKALADLCGGWWRWDYTVERECFVPMDEWRKLASGSATQ